MIIVTQLNPDLDACMGVWLLRRFGGHKDAKLRFVSTGDKISDVRDQEFLYVDTSGGKYDHHHDDRFVCAASLILEDLRLQADEALNEMVRFALYVDHGLLMGRDLGQFNLVHIIQGLNRSFPDNPWKVVEIAESVLDGLYEYTKEFLEAKRELEKGTRFDTNWGSGLGVETANKQVRYLAYENGHKVFVFVDPKRGFRGYQAPGFSGIDFSDLFQKIKQREPDADWFLHSSKELLLCGSAKAPNKRLSRLSLRELIELIAEPELPLMD
ncbi:MAG: chromate resistance protein ChrB domain-containing protein [Candidatus Methylomirabilales bacterium]